MSIKTKIQLYTALLLLFMLLLVSLAIYFLFHKLTTDTEVERVTAQTETIVEALRADFSVQASDLFRAYMPASGMVRLINEAGESISTVTKEARLTQIPTTFRTQQGHTFYTMEDGERYVIAYFPTIWTDGSIVTLEVTESLAPVQETLHTLRVVLTVSSLLVLIPSIIGGRLISNLILRPLKAIVGTMKEIQERGIFKQIELKGRSKDELYKLADTFNTMINKLKTNFEKQEQFVSDASHELKTPLTVIDSYVHLLKRWGHRKPEVMDEAIEALSSETERMKSLIQQLLTLAKDASDGQVKLEKIDVIALCRSTVERFRQTYEREIDVQTLTPQVYAMVDEQKIKQVLYILLDNALKYSADKVTVQVRSQEDTVNVTVEDRGQGIPAKDIPHIFDRFYRVDKTRSRESGGTGLGLSIARSLVRAHHGEISVQSEEHRGSVFTVTLPAAE